MNNERQSQELLQLISKVSAYSNPAVARSVLESAFQIAEKSHEGAQRIDEQPYILHPLAVASILAEWHAPVQVVAVGLLHDLFNPQYSRGYISKEDVLERVMFTLGKNIAHLLNVVAEVNTFIRHVEGSDFYNQADLNDFWVGIANFLDQASEAVIVKIADRLHNLQTSSVLTRNYQEQIATAGLYLLAPLAGRLGMGKVKCEVENFSFQITEPVYYQLLQRQYDNPGFQQQVGEIVDEIRQVLSEQLPEVKVVWRPQSLYSTWQDINPGRWNQLDRSIVRVADAGAFVVLTQEKLECYQALGILHQRFTPVEGQMRDQIATLRENGSKALLTQVNHRSGNNLRILIRTASMDMIAEYGMTARWWGVTEQFMPYLLVQKKSVDEMIQVFTPIGELKLLPPGATPLDFAYHIHTDVGHHCIDVLVNGVRGDLFQPLQQDDRVEIVTGGTKSGPSLEWLRHVKTPQALSRIRQWLSINKREDMKERGRALLDGELSTFGLDSSDPSVFRLLEKVAQRERLRDIDSLFVSIGVERTRASKFVDSLKSMRLKSLRAPNHREPHDSVQVLASEFERFPTTFARCCDPVWGDEIVGYQRSDHVIVIHKRDCMQIADKMQLIQLKWRKTRNEPDSVILIKALNRPGLARDISEIISMLAIDMPIFYAARHPDGVMADVQIYLGRTTLNQQHRILKALEGVASIDKIEMIQAPLQQAPAPPFATTRIEAPPVHLVSASTGMHREQRHPNPYGSGIAEGSRFYGREVEKERVVGLLKNRTQNVAILLWGQRRIGKTSFVLHLKEQASDIFLPIYIDLQGLKEASTTMFLYRFMDRISQVLKDNLVEVEHEVTVPALNRLRKDPLTYFDTFMDRIENITRDHPLLLMLDEFQCLNSLREEKATRSAIFNRLRSHSQHWQGIHLIVSGGGLLSYLQDQSDVAALFNIAQPEKLNCLEADSAHQLIKDGLSKVGNITDHAITQLINYTAGHPYYLQLLCSMLYDYAQEHKLAITADVVSLRIREWLVNADASRFQHFWEGYDIPSTRRNKLILSALAQLGDATYSVEFDSLVDAIGAVVSEYDLAQSLNDLSELGVLNHYQANYSIKVGLFGRWLHQHSPLKIALKEASHI